jgi:hypothetical protein
MSLLELFDSGFGIVPRISTIVDMDVPIVTVNGVESGKFVAE